MINSKGDLRKSNQPSWRNLSDKNNAFCLQKLIDLKIMPLVWTVSPQTLTQHQPSSFIGWLRLANARSWHVVMSNSLDMTNADYGQDGSGSQHQTAAHFLNTTITGNRNKCLKGAGMGAGFRGNWRRDTAGKRRLASGMLFLGLWQCRDRHALTLLLCQLKGRVECMTGAQH